MSDPIDTQAELKLLRAERMNTGGKVPIRKRINARASAVAPRERVDIVKQRRRSLFLLTFGMVRIVLWTILGVLIVLGLAGFDGFHWAKVLSESLPFVALISVYANWATDLDGATAAFAALVAADVHHDVAVQGSTVVGEIAKLRADIQKLSTLQPGQEADELENSIQSRITDAKESVDDA